MKNSKPGNMSKAEMEVMREVWSISGTVTVSGLMDILGERRGWKTSTLSTIMNRLIDKGFLTKSLNGKTNIYMAVMTEEAYKARETKSFLNAVHNGSVKSFFAALTSSGDIDTGEIDEIRAWLQEKARDSE